MAKIHILKMNSFFFLLLFFFSGSLLAHDVEQLGNINQWQINGNQTFTDQQIRHALQSDAPVLLASHPLANLLELPGIVKDRLQEGYRKSGFIDPNVRVITSLDDQLLKIEIEEGKRYKYGEIRFNRLSEQNKIKLKKLLTVKQPADDAVIPIIEQNDNESISHWTDKNGKALNWKSAVWQQGKIAAYDEKSQEQFAKQVGDAFSKLGYSEAQFTVVLKPVPKLQEVDLEINLIELGVNRAIEKIEIEGLHRDTQAEVLQYLDLSINTPVSEISIDQLSFQLWKSGRYISHEIKIIDGQSASDATLSIKLVEAPLSPPLLQPLNDAEKILLKMGRYFSNSKLWQKDLKLSFSHEGADFVLYFSPRLGLMIQSDFQDAQQNFSCLFSKEAIGLYLAGSDHYYQTQAPQDNLSLLLGLEATTDEDVTEDNKYFNLNINVGVHGAQQKDILPLQFGVKISPAACLAFANTPETEVKFEQEIVHVKGKKFNFQLDRQTGEILKWLDTDSWLVEYEKDAFQRQAQTLQKELKQKTNVYHPQEPLQSLVRFVTLIDVPEPWIEEFQKNKWINNWTPADFDQWMIGFKFASTGILEPLDHWVMQLQDQPVNQFKIPSPKDLELKDWKQLAAHAAIPLASQLFPNDSWPWTIWRETSFAMAGKTKFTKLQLIKLYNSEDLGPLAFLSISELTRFVDPNISKLFAKKGLKKLTWSHFRNDLKPWLDEHYVIGQTMDRIFRAIRLLSDRELQQLQSTLPNRLRNPGESFCHQLRGDQSLPLEETLPLAIQAAWENGLQSELELRLKKLAGEQ